MVDCDTHLLHVGTWVCCCKACPLQSLKLHSSVACLLSLLTSDLVCKENTSKRAPPSLINGGYKNAPRDLKAFTLFLRSIVKSEIFSVLFMKIQAF